MTSKTYDINKLQKVLDEAVELAKTNHQGEVANYIPELASAPEDMTAVSVTLTDGTCLSSGNYLKEEVTLQSAAKLVILIGLLEELGVEEMMKWVKFEPSGDGLFIGCTARSIWPKAFQPDAEFGCDRIMWAY